MQCFERYIIFSDTARSHFCNELIDIRVFLAGQAGASAQSFVKLFVEDFCFYYLHAHTSKTLVDKKKISRLCSVCKSALAPVGKSALAHRMFPPPWAAAAGKGKREY